MTVITASGFRDLVSGRRRGILPALARFGLHLIEVPYTLAVQWRNRRYDTGAAFTHWLPVPVVSVGNITLGGTGKTPMVAWVAQWYRRYGIRVAIVSRGYAAPKGVPNDEALELGRYLPDVPHLQQADRLAAALAAIRDHQAQIIILDDGFQHRRLHRDLDLVLIDALEPFGFDHVFPRGMLREPVSELRRADVVVLSRAELLERDEREEIRRRVLRHNSRVVWAETTHAPQYLVNYRGEREAIRLLRRQPVAAFCGIGNPAAFRFTLESCGYRVIAFQEFPDHHPYTPADFERLAQWAKSLNVKALLCTQKDLVKIPLEQVGDRPLWAIAVEIEIVRGSHELETKLQSLLSQPPIA